MAFSVSVSSLNSHQNLGQGLATSMLNMVSSLEKSQGISRGQSQQAQQTQPALQDRFTFSLDNSANATMAALTSAQSGQASGAQGGQQAQSLSQPQTLSMSDAQLGAVSYADAVAMSAGQNVQTAANNGLSQFQPPSANIMKLLG
jgi:hypothetical protein